MGIGVITAQTRVRGTVVDEAGEPIIGASVLIKGTSGGTATNADGNFSLSAPENGILIISYLGYETQEVSVSANVRVVLIEGSKSLDELVVVGYGSGQKIGSITGSIVTVNSESIRNKASANVVDALQGRVPGVMIYTSSGEPSATSSIVVRGVGTLEGSSAPLYILDGIAVNSTTVLALNPNDLESVSVLKDASATSI